MLISDLRPCAAGTQTEELQPRSFGCIAVIARNVGQKTAERVQGEFIVYIIEKPKTGS